MANDIARQTIDLRQSENPVEIVVVRGDVDIATSPRLHQKLMECLASDPSEVVVDLSEVTFIDSTGLGVLVNARQRARSIGAVLKLQLPEGQARYPFEVTGLIAVFEHVTLA